jgi:hypothetical protein
VITEIGVGGLHFMNNLAVIFDPYAAADLRNIVETIVVNHNVASTGQAEWTALATPTLLPIPRGYAQ